MYANEEYATRLIRAGVSGFLVKAASTDELKAAMRKVAGGGVYLSLSKSTVETYRGRVLEKLNLRNNSDITRFAIRRKLIDLD